MYLIFELRSNMDAIERAWRKAIGEHTSNISLDLNYGAKGVRNMIHL